MISPHGKGVPEQVPVLVCYANIAILTLRIVICVKRVLIYCAF